MPTEEQVREALKAVIDPELHQNIVDLGMVRRIDFFDGGPSRRRRLADDSRLPDPRPTSRTGVADAVGKLEGVSSVNVGFDVLSA